MSENNWAGFFGHGQFSLLDMTSGFSQLLIFVGVISALIYFFFSKAHTGLFGGVARFGIWILMIGFGASFGFTVMARISLFIQRIQDMDQRWIQTAFNTSNPNYHFGFQLVFWLMVLAVVVYIIMEIAAYLGRRKSAVPQE